jgi:TonB family protein
MNLKNLKKMNSYLQYAFQSAFSLTILYSLYYLLLRKETYFQLNRFYLLGTLLLSAILPFISADAILKLFGIGTQDLLLRLNGIIAPGSNTLPEVEVYAVKSPGLWVVLGVVVYFSGVLLFVARLLIGIGKIFVLKRKGVSIKFQDHSIIYHKKKHAPFSFFKHVFLNDSLKNSDKIHYIIQHELVHVKQLHSVDMIISELFVALFWFNPFIWFTRKSLRETHEYLADNGIKKTNSKFEEYQALLLTQLNRLNPIHITNNFNSTIKNRIKMMYTKKSNSTAKLKPLFIIPVLIILTLVFACTKIENNTNSDTDSISDIETNDASAENLFFVVEEMPEFNGGDPAQEFRKYISKNLEYPLIASENGISGRVIVQFQVNERGKVTDAVVVRSVDPALDKEAIRVVMSSPKWKPGKHEGKKVKILFTFPINFNLE